MLGLQTDRDRSCSFGIVTGRKNAFRPHRSTLEMIGFLLTLLLIGSAFGENSDVETFKSDVLPPSEPDLSPPTQGHHRPDTFTYHLKKFGETLISFFTNLSVVLGVFVFLLVQYIGYKIMKLIGKRSDERKARQRENKTNEKIEMRGIAPPEDLMRY